MDYSHIELLEDDLNSGHIEGLLEQHRQEMFKHSPPESVHALDAQALRAPNMSFWSAWINDEFAGCGALKQLNESHGEIKSMKTRPEHLKKGVAKALLTKIIDQARVRGFDRLSLETGTMDVFIPARELYKKFGFKECPPFADYFEDPNSVCMTLNITKEVP